MPVLFLTWVFLPVSAGAVLWTRIELNPRDVHKDEPARITVFTFMLQDQQCWNDPAAKPVPLDITGWTTTGDAPFRGLELIALGPHSERLKVPLTARPQQHAYWDGTTHFPAEGIWTLNVSFVNASQLSNVCSGYMRTVTILPAGLPAHQNGLSFSMWQWALIALSFGIGVAVFGAYLRRRRMSKSTRESTG